MEDWKPQTKVVKSAEHVDKIVIEKCDGGYIVTANYIVKASFDKRTVDVAAAKKKDVVTVVSVMLGIETSEKNAEQSAVSVQQAAPSIPVPGRPAVPVPPVQQQPMVQHMTQPQQPVPQQVVR